MTDPVYANYWARKRLHQECPPFPVVRCSGRAIDGEVLEIIKRSVIGKSRLLDVGAGNLQVRDILQGEGFVGEYETLDIGTEFSYTYDSIAQVVAPMDAILLLDVLEHLPLRDGLALVQECFRRLAEGGVLVLQTPNGRCVRSPFSSDMTHVQSYNLPDLWAYLTALGCKCEGYRVVFQTPQAIHQRAIALVGQAITTRLLGLDYADNILLVAQKPASARGASAKGASTSR